MSAPTWAPDAAQVGALLPVRFGPAGPTTSTVPSVGQVEAIISLLTPGLLVEVGTVGADQYDLAKTTLTLGAAAYIENSFLPEQNEIDSGNAEFFRRRYQEHIVLLRREIRTNRRVRIGQTLEQASAPPVIIDALPGEGWTP